jgi:hypothetical protein
LSPTCLSSCGKDSQPSGCTQNSRYIRRARVSTRDRPQLIRRCKLPSIFVVPPSCFQENDETRNLTANSPFLEPKLPFHRRLLSKILLCFRQTIRVYQIPACCRVNGLSLIRRTL